MNGIAGVSVFGPAQSAAQTGTPDPEVIRLSVRSIAEEYERPGRVIVLRLPESDPALDHAIRAANTGLRTAASHDVLVCTPKCRISGGDIAFSLTPLEFDSAAAEIRVWVTVENDHDSTGISREVWLVSLLQRGGVWLVTRKEMEWQT